jgi:hypothetical protein
MLLAAACAARAASARVRAFHETEVTLARPHGTVQERSDTLPPVTPHQTDREVLACA